MRRAERAGIYGERKSVARYLKRFQEGVPLRFTGKLAWLFMKDAVDLRGDEVLFLRSLFLKNPMLKEIYRLTQTFQQMISQQASELLDEWLDKMDDCGIKKLKNFAWGLRQDYDAVKAALIND